MQDGFVPVLAGPDAGPRIGHVAKFSRRTGKLTIQITDPEVVQELVDSERIDLRLSFREIPRHHERP